jgi:phage shock protein A
MSIDKANELSAAEEKLAALIARLKDLEQAYDKAVEHSASYHGNNESIEKGRDEKAYAILKDIQSIKEEIRAQSQVIQKLIENI